MDFISLGCKQPKLESLPVELIAEILEALDLSSLCIISCLSRRLRLVASDPALNPWKGPIMRNLFSRDAPYEPCLTHLSERSSLVPRSNWVDVLVIARPEFLLFEVTLPNLPDEYYAEAFSRRFLPSWTKVKKDGRTWKEAYRKILFRVWHRSTTTCTSDEAWTKYLVLNRNGSVNLLETSSRTFNPQHLFNELKIQNNLAHLETRIRLVVEFADVRILSFGVLGKPRSTFTINDNARLFLRPPGISGPESLASELSSRLSVSETASVSTNSQTYSVKDYEPLLRPQPSFGHSNYPLFTPGGEDTRWAGSEQEDERRHFWVGGMLVCAQLCCSETRTHSGEGPFLQDLDLVVGPGRSKYISLGWADLDAIAPWLSERVSKRIDGQGLGN